MNKDEIRILLLDDEPEVVKSIERILSLNYQVFSSTNPSQARKFLQSEQVHIAIIDQNLQDEITGLSFASEIKRYDSQIKVIMLTGETGSSSLVIDALNSNSIDSFLTKPFDAEELERYIQQNIQLQEYRDKKIAEIVEDIRAGHPLTSEDINKLGDDLVHLENVLFEYRLSNGIKQEKVNILGFVLFDDFDIINYQTISDSFHIHDKFLLRGLFKTLDRLSGDLFVKNNGQDQSLDEIRLPNFIAKVQKFEDLMLVVFVNVELPSVIEEELIKFFKTMNYELERRDNYEDFGQLCTNRIYSLIDRINELQ